METCQLSQLLFQYLSQIFGSEKVVRARRLFYGVEDCCLVTFPFRTVNSGSKAEGLDFPGSDIDIMWIYLRDEVYPDFKSCPQNDFPCLYIGTDDTAPGFAHINVRTNTLSRGKSHSKIILQNSWFKKCFPFFGDNSTLSACNTKHLLSYSMKTHGPCQSSINDSIDHVFSFKLHSWPNIASGWILRPRPFDWPPSRIMSNIVNENVLLVPIGSKFGSLEDNPNEWRLSFSLSEKLLVHSFNHTQLMCYVLLKILLNEILNKNMVTKNVLCSYFMKTILFWTIEETGCSVWIPTNLVKCFRACITKLSYLLKLKHLPHYFIPENNMIEGKLSEDSLSNLCTLLDLVNNEGVGFTRRTDTLQDFLTILHRKFTIKYQADEAYVLSRLLQCTKYTSSSELRARKFLFFLDTFKTKLIRFLFYCFFLRRLNLFPLQDKYDVNRRNKSLYCNYKSSLGYSLMGTKLSLSSWLSVAIIFYSHKNYKTALKITDFIQSENLFMRSFAFENTMERIFSIRQKIKLRYCKSLIDTFCEYTTETMIAKTDLLFNSPAISFAAFSFSRSFMIYLRFMCFHHLKNISKRTNAAFELFEVDDFEDGEVFECRHLTLGQSGLLVMKVCNMSHMSIPTTVLIKSLHSSFKLGIPNIPFFSEPRTFSIFKQIFNDLNHWVCQH